MNFTFGKQSQPSNSQQIQQIKQWVYQVLEVNEEIPVSLSQLQCTEPGCPPIETVINVMLNPVQQYKIHKSMAEIEYADISQLLDK
ncbi:MAG: hypothetical protein QNJ47_24230 [Nostocaceae cyanobacterium]|nr:hypothetical protein [Nostocaceae cyanobacterium]